MAFRIVFSYLLSQKTLRFNQTTFSSFRGDSRNFFMSFGDYLNVSANGLISYMVLVRDVSSLRPMLFFCCQGPHFTGMQTDEYLR